MTPAKKETITLIHSGYSNMQIADEIVNKFDLLDSQTNELYRYIESTRREIFEFRAQAPALAELGFSQGYGWKEIVAAIELPGLLSSFEITQICVAARDKVKTEQTEQPVA